MDKTFEKLSLFFDKIKTIGFWQRIFGWHKIRELSYDAYEEFKKLIDDLKEAEQTKNSIGVLNNTNEHLKEKIADRDKELSIMKERITQLTNNIEQFKEENIVFKQTEDDRKAKYENDVANLNAVTTKIQSDRQKEEEERQRNEIERIESMKETWAKHQKSVEQAIKMICEKHIIEYVDKVPFKGSPDNTIKLCDEYVVFDAKSPSSDDLDNFPNYIKLQTESVKKYIKEENVRKDIFLVIPSNTVQVIESFSYNMADYNVYIVTLDVLEPLILALKKIEDYEFVNELSPEERENICRIIGKFIHMTKRRIQIDHFFIWELLEILTKCQADLPKEIIDKVIEFEKAEKLNPPQERRVKQILTKHLKSDNARTQREAEAKGIVFPSTIQKKLKDLPLYETDNK